MSDVNPIGPVCAYCGHDSFNEIPIMEFDMTWICCSKCGKAIACRDHILLDKLDAIFEATTSKG